MSDFAQSFVPQDVKEMITPTVPLVSTLEELLAYLESKTNVTTEGSDYQRVFEQINALESQSIEVPELSSSPAWIEAFSRYRELSSIQFEALQGEIPKENVVQTLINILYPYFVDPALSVETLSGYTKQILQMINPQGIHPDPEEHCCHGTDGCHGCGDCGDCHCGGDCHCN